MLFFEVKEDKKYIYIRRKGFTLPLSLVPLGYRFIIAPVIILLVGFSFIVSLLKANPVLIAVSIILVFGFYFLFIWMAIEGIKTSRIVSKYRKIGKKIEYLKGKQPGISEVKIHK